MEYRLCGEIFKKEKDNVYLDSILTFLPTVIFNFFAHVAAIFVNFF